MANKKISELPYINVSKISGNTLVPLVTYFSATTGDTVHTYVDDFQTYLISGLTGQTDVFVTGGTYSAGTITITNNTGGTFNITGLTTGSTTTIGGDYLPLSGGTVTGDTIFNQGLSASTISATTYLNLPITTDVFVTGGTYSNGDATFTNNTGGTFNVTGFYTGSTDIFVSGGTYSAGTITFTNTSGGTFNVTGLTTGSTSIVSGDYLPLSGGTVTGKTDFQSGVTINILTATTIVNTYLDSFYIRDNSGTLSIDNTTRRLLKSDGSTTSFDWENGILTGQTNIESSTISATTYQNLPDNVTGNYLPLSGGTVTGQTFFTSGVSISGSVETSGSQVYHKTDLFVVENQTINGSLIEATNSGVNIWSSNTNISIDAEARYLYESTGSQVTLDWNQGYLADPITGLYSLLWYNRQLIKSDGTTISFDWENGILTGQTNIESSTISATTYQNLPLGIYGTGLTFNTGNYDLTLDGQNGTLDTISLSILASDLTVTGGTYDPNTGVATFTNNTGGTFNVTGFLTGMTDTFVTGGTYSAGTITFTNTSGGTFEVTGLTTGDTTTITGATSVGTGLTIFDSVVNRNIQINSITGDSLNKISTTLNSNTIEVGINEQNLTLWPLVVNGNRLLDGSVSYVSGLTFSISPLSYIIDGVIYNISATTEVTLNSGDTTFDRIDVIFADISGNTGVLEGTPSANPEKPIVDSNIQVEVTFVSVPANSTSAGITTRLIYDENVGQPTEFNFLRFGNQTFRISGDSTAQAYSGSKSISVSGLTVSGGNWSNGFILSATTSTDTNQFATLEFAIRNMSANTNNTQILIQFLNSTGGVLNGGNVILWGNAPSGGYINYNATSNTTSWQLISIPLWRFYLTNTNVFGVRFSYAVGTTAARHYFDRIRLVEGSASAPPSNSWTKIKGDSATTITAPNPNSTLTISGGTNISSSISGTSTVVLNLDSNINLNGITATTISATTYQNLPLSATTYVSGGTYSAGTITFTNTSGGTFEVTGLTTGSTSTVSGDYLPLSGGTVTGDTLFTSGLTASTLTVTGLTQTKGITSTGGIIFPHKTITANYTATTSDYFINITGGTFDVTLQSAVGVEGKLLVVKNEGVGIINVLSVSGQTIDDRTDVLLTEGNSLQIVSDGKNWVILGYNISSTQANTGVIEFSGLSKVSSTQFSVGPVKGFVVDDTTNPVIPFLTYVEYSGGTFTDNYVNTDFETFVYITSGGTIGQQPTPLTEQQRRQNIFLGKIGHPEKISINLVFSQPDFVLSPLSQLRDIFAPINLINGGVYPSANGANLKINTSAGYVYGLGVNFTTNRLNPNALSVSGTSPCTFQYRTQTGGTITNVTDIDPLYYDVAGVKTLLSGTKVTNQRIYLLQNGEFRVQYGQVDYNTLSLAIQGLQTETFTVFPNFINDAVLIGILTVLSTATDLTDTSKSKFFFVSKFGETVGATGGVSTTNLQQAYNNSSQPEIIINSTLDGLSIKNGTGSADNVTKLLEGINTAGTTTSFINADGSISGFSFTTAGFSANTGGLTATTVSATTYQNLPTDVRVTGATYSNNTFTYTNNTGGTFTTLFNTVTGLTINGNLTVTGNTNVRAFTGTTGYISGSGQNILTVIGSGNSTTSPLFTVQGSSGELFSVNDSLVGSLFSVNDISGLPILEVFSDNTTLMGSYQAPSLNTTTRVTLTAGTNTVYSIPTSAYTGAFIDYTLVSTGTTGARAGNIMTIWSGTTAQYTETSTNDIGNTAGVTFSVAVSGNNAVLSSSATTTGWTLKTIVRSI